MQQYLTNFVNAQHVYFHFFVYVLSQYHSYLQKELSANDDFSVQSPLYNTFLETFNILKQKINGIYFIKIEHVDAKTCIISLFPIFITEIIEKIVINHLFAFLANWGSTKYIHLLHDKYFIH